MENNQVYINMQFQQIYLNKIQKYFSFQFNSNLIEIYNKHSMTFVNALKNDAQLPIYKV